jgi:hypothetical protein
MPQLHRHGMCSCSCASHIANLSGSSDGQENNLHSHGSKLKRNAAKEKRLEALANKVLVDD